MSKCDGTRYEASGGKLYSNQYAVTDSAKNVMLNKGELTGLPGIFLVYEFNPFMVEKVEKVIPLSHFVTQVPLGLAATQDFYVIYVRTLIKSRNIQRPTTFCILQLVPEAYPCVIHPSIHPILEICVIARKLKRIS